MVALLRTERVTHLCATPDTQRALLARDDVRAAQLREAGEFVEAYDRALALVQEKGWDIVTADKSSGRIEATVTTRFFGFKDDVVVRITPSGSGARVDLRSVSRVGRSDVGTNARRIEDFMDDLQS